jgi:hypothetical protein
MSTLAFKVFSGEVPQKPPHLLSDENSQRAVNCDFSHGDLRPLNGGFFLKNLAGAVKGLYTEDGIRFMSWPIDTQAFKGPVVGDVYNRVYFCNSTGFYVTTSDQATLGGGPPATSYLVGVPPLTVAPTITLTNRTSLPDYPNAVIKLRFFRDSGGTRYDEQDVTATELTKFFKYQFTEPATTTTTGSTTSTAARTVYAVYVSNAADGSVLAPVNGNIVVTAGDACTVVSTGASINGAGQSLYYTDKDGTQHLFSDFLAGLAASSSTSASATLNPAVQVTLYDPDSKQNVFVVVSVNTSAGGTVHTDAIPGGAEVVLAKVDGTTNQWTVSINYGIYETRAYVVTLVNKWNEESQSSPPTTVNITYMQEATIAFPWSASNYTGVIVPDKYRVYRSVSGTNPTYISATASPIALNPVSGTVSYVDRLLVVKETDAVLQSASWLTPPSGMSNLTAMPNGFFMASKGNTVYLSEPYRPWAWPYSMTFPSTVVGIVATEQTAVITTLTLPFVVNGVNPDNMAQARLAIQQAGISQNSMATLEGQVVYASNDGIVAVAGQNASLNSSQQLFRRDDWRNRYGTILPTMKWAVYDGALVGVSTTDTNSFVIRLDEDIGDYTQLSLQADALFMLPQTDQLYYAQGSSLYQYRGGTALTFDWWSKDFLPPKPLNFGAGFLRATGPVTLTVYQDGAVWVTKQISPGYFRLPSGRKSRRWSFRLSGVSDVFELHIAETLKELANV